MKKSRRRDAKVPWYCVLTLWAAGIFLVALNVSATPASTHPDAVRSGGCSSSAKASGIVTRNALDGNRKSRTYLLDFPTDYDSSHPYSLVYIFHGANGTVQDKSSGLRDVEGAAQSAIFVYPQGIPHKDEGVGWDDSAAGYDIPFFDNMLSDIAATVCIDTTRVFAEGFSWGGDFVTALTCARGEKIRAVVAIATTDEYSNHSDYTSYQNFPCPSRRHPAILFMHAVDGDAGYPAPLFHTTSNLFKYMNACGSKGTVAPSGSPIMACVTYNACTPEYTECFFDHGIGHAQPPHWTQAAWAFFSKF